jgi:mannosyltransferase OCH1-like enzyme
MHPNKDNYRISENDNLRSEYIRKIVQNIIPTNFFHSDKKTQIPKNIVQFWHDFNNIPDDVNDCIKSWEPLREHGFARLLFDNTSAKNYILKYFGKYYVKAYDLCHHPAMRCDYFRLCYILQDGGFYIDADEYFQGNDCSRLFEDNYMKIQPLCYDIATDKMIKTDNFINKLKYSPTWIFYVNNNPLIAPPGHPIIKLALHRATRLLLRYKNKVLDIQSTTGPGNLSASLVLHSLTCELYKRNSETYILPDWESISITPWPLSYRNDVRNWRLWDKTKIWNY